MKTLAAVLVTAILMAACAVPGEIPRSDDLFARIDDGMTTDDVRRLLGPPDETMRFPLSRTEAWDYRYYDTWGYMAVFSVTFSADGRAVSKISRRINDGGDHSS
jgi:outer membrane protein assembly factor BamE (lipoprotein component of BamABCDE complex)